MNTAFAKHIKFFNCDHGTTCNSCKGKILPTEKMYLEGSKELCNKCGAAVEAAWEKYYKPHNNA